MGLRPVAEHDRVEGPTGGRHDHPDIARYEIELGRDGSLLIFGLRGNVFRSSDEGLTWTAVASGDQRTLMGGTARNDGSIVLAGSAGVVLASSNAGLSFDVIPTEGNRVYSGVAIIDDDKLLLVGFGGVSTLQRNSND